MSNLQTIISSPPDRENVVFEIWSGSQQVAEISREPGQDYNIEIYPAPDDGVWRFDLIDLKNAIEDGIKELSGNLRGID